MTLKNIIEMVEKAIAKLLFCDGDVIVETGETLEDKITLKCEVKDIDNRTYLLFNVELFKESYSWQFAQVNNVKVIDNLGTIELENLNLLNTFIDVFVRSERVTSDDVNVEELKKQVEELENELQATRNELEDLTDELDDVKYERDELQETKDTILYDLEEAQDKAQEVADLLGSLWDNVRY